MASVNRVTLIGNLGQDPELRYTQAGQAVCNLSIATNEKWKDKANQLQERVEWHRIIVWGKSAEAAAQYLAKGRSVYIEGRLQTRDWEDRDGNKRQTTEIVATSVQFLGSKPGGNSPGNPGSQHGGGQASAQDPAQDYSGDDIPF